MPSAFKACWGHFPPLRETQDGFLHTAHIVCAFTTLFNFYKLLFIELGQSLFVIDSRISEVRPYYFCCIIFWLGHYFKQNINKHISKQKLESSRLLQFLSNLHLNKNTNLVRICARLQVDKIFQILRQSSQFVSNGCLLNCISILKSYANCPCLQYKIIMLKQT